MSKAKASGPAPREYFLFRRLDNEKTLGFRVFVKIERGPKEYISTLLPLDPGTVIGAGTTPDEAERDALDLFQSMVDHCLAHGQLSELLGQSNIMREINVSIDDMLSAMIDEDSPSVPPPWLLGPRMANSPLVDLLQ